MTRILLLVAGLFVIGCVWDLTPVPFSTQAVGSFFCGAIWALFWSEIL